MTFKKNTFCSFIGVGSAALLLLSACTDSGKRPILKKETQRCEEQLSAVINPSLYEGIDPQAIDERAMILAMHDRMEPSRREATGDNIRLIVTQHNCSAYDRAGNILGEYSMALSTDTLIWWVRADNQGELSMTEMVQKYNKKGAPLEAKQRLQFALNRDQKKIEQTVYLRTGGKSERVFASYDYNSETRTLKMTTEHRVKEFADDGRLNRSFYCYELSGPNCQDPTKWEVHNYEYNDSGLVIAGHGFAEGKSGQNEDYRYERDFELNERGHVIREAGKMFGDEDGDWVWGEERRILYYD